MAVTDSELEVVYSRLELRAFYARTIAVGLCNTRHQAEFDAGAFTVKIPKNQTVITERDYTDGDNWHATSDDVDIDYDDWTPTVSKQARIKIPWKAANLVPLDMVEQAADRYSRTHAENVDKYILNDIIVPGVPAANTKVYGDATHFIAPDGEVTGGNETQALIWQLLRQFKLMAAIANVSTPTADSPSDLWAVMGPHLWDPLEEYLRASGNSDAISYEVIRNGMVARLLGILDIIQTNHLDAETVATKAHSPVICGINAATSWATRPGVTQTFSPAENQAGPYWQLNRWRQYGAVVENPVPLFKAQVRQEA